MAADSAQKKQQIIEAAMQHLLTHGFANSGLRALAKSAGISDRMVMYYFATKDDLITEALLLMAEGMATSLAQLVPQKRASATEIVQAITQAGHSAEVVPVLRLWFEIVGRAVAGHEPYKATAALILQNWETWLADKLGPKQAHRAGELLAQIEGQIMVALIRA